MADNSADSRKLSSRYPRIAAALHWRAVLRWPLHLPRLLWRGIWLAFFVLGIGFLLLRYVAAPQIAQQRGRIEQAISQELGLRVEIAELDANWSGLRPELSIRNFRIFDQENRIALELPQVEVSVAWSSLLHRRLILDRLEILHPELSIRRKADGSLFIAGLRIDPQKEGGGDSGFGDFVLTQHQILIRDARLVWSDEQRDAPELALDHVNLRLLNSGRSHRFALLASPPAAYSANLDVRGDLSGQGFKRLEDWRGTFYLSLDDADLAVWQKWLDYPLAIPRGRGGLRTWLTFNGKHVDSLTSDIALAGVSLQFSKKLPVLDLASLQGRINLTADKDEVNFAATNLSLSTQDGVHLGPTRVGFHYRSGTGAISSEGRFSSGELDVRMLSQLAASLPLPESLAKRLVEADPAGRLVDVKLGWQGQADKIEHFEVDARLEAMSFKSVAQLPGAEGLDAQLKGTERGGEFKFRIKNGMLHVPMALREGDVPVSQLLLNGRWGYEKVKGSRAELMTVHVDSGHLANPHIPSADFAGYWQAREHGAGYLELRASARRALLEDAWRYIPASTVEYVPDWLHESLRAGFADDLRFQIAGDLEHFPFNKSPGIFRLETRLVDAKLNTFAQGWPGVSSAQGSLVLDRQRLTIRLDKGYYQGVLMHDNKIEIADLMDAGRQVLTVDGKASGATTDFLAYVNNSNLAELAGSFTRELRAQGGGELRLHIEVPLHESRNTRVKGDYRFTGNTVKLVPSLPDFSEANGTLEFTEKGLSLVGADAYFLGKRLRANGVTESDGSFRVDIQGVASVGGLRRLVPYRLWNHLQGETPVNVVLRVRHSTTEITVDSNFAGIASDLPQPLAKEVSERWPVRIGLRMEGHDNSAEGMTQTWRVKLDSRLDVTWAELCRAGKCGAARGAVAVGEDAVAPQQGWRMSGTLKRVDVDQWQPIVGELLVDVGAEGATGGAAGQGGQSSASGDLAVVTKVSELLALGHRFRDVSGKALRHDGKWILHLDGPDIAGDLNWDESGSGSLHARLSQLSLQPVTDDTKELNTNALSREYCLAHQPPSMDVVADHFRIRNMDLGTLNLAAVSQNNQWLLNKISLTAPDMTIDGSGSWQCESGSFVAFTLNSDNAGSMLGHFGLSHSMRKGKVEFKGNLTWHGVPTALDFPSMSGSLILKASDGQFTELEPGAGRLLGILSLQSLPRRLMGNVDDVIAKGFAFDSIKGEDMRVEKGVLYTEDLEVRGPAARVFIKGSTNLGTETHNLTMRVQPTMSDPVAIGVVTGQAIVGVANPVLGLSLYLGQKVLRDPVEKIFSYDLEVTGPWSDPKVEKKAERIEDRIERIEPQVGVSVPGFSILHREGASEPSASPSP
jgi:uncharacterized protein (TIGR02099 family)